MTPEERFNQETISHSGLSAFKVSPKSYRRYKDLQTPEESTYSLGLGSAVHAYILEPDVFYERYVEAPQFTPTPMYKTFAEEVHKLRKDTINPTSVENKALIYIKAYEVAGFKIPGLPRVIQRFEEEEMFSTYLKFLDTVEGKEVLSAQDMLIIKTCKESTTHHKLASVLLYDTLFKTCLNENEILFTYPGYKFKMKAILDRIVIDEAEKICYVIDVKTTSKNVYSFADSYSFYGYYRQLYLYMVAAKALLAERGLKSKEFQIRPYIVAIQTKDNYETAVFKPSTESLKTGRNEVENLLTDLNWHYENDLWDFTREYYEGDGSLIVDLKPD